MDQTPPTRILIADDHPLFRGALREAIGGVAPRLAVAEAGTFDEMVRELEREPETDLVLLDLAMIWPSRTKFSTQRLAKKPRPSLTRMGVFLRART